MKSYYQQKKNGFLLDDNIYAKTVREIQCYNTYKKIVRDINNKSPIDITENDVINKSLAEKYIEIFDNTLVKWVDEDYRECVFNHVVNKIIYEELEEEYYLSISCIKRWVQVYVYGVAVELGEDFR